MRRTLISILMAGLFCSACSSWPEDGSGGAAEHRAVYLDDSELGMQLTAKVEQTDDYLLMLGSQGGKSCAPGRLKALQDQLVQVKREAYGRLYEDSQWHLEQLLLNIRDYECLLEKLRKTTACYQKTDDQPLKQWVSFDGPLSCEANDTESRIDLSTDYVSLTLTPLFHTDKATIIDAFRSQLDELAMALKQHPRSYVEITGHTDSRGSENHNEALSELRAVTLQEYLADAGVPRGQIKSAFEGERRLRTNEPSQLMRFLNRRVELKVFLPSSKEGNL